MGFIKDRFLGGDEERAARTQANAVDEAITDIQGAGATASGRFDELSSATGRAINPLVDAAIAGRDISFDRSEGFNAIQKSAAAGGKGLRSGETLRDLTQFNEGLEGRRFQERVNNLFGLVGINERAAGNQAEIGLRTGENVAGARIGKGDVLASGIIAKKNALRGTINDVAGAVSGSKFLDRFKSRV